MDNQTGLANNHPKKEWEIAYTTKNGKQVRKLVKYSNMSRTVEKLEESGAHSFHYRPYT